MSAELSQSWAHECRPSAISDLCVSCVRFDSKSHNFGIIQEVRGSNNSATPDLFGEFDDRRPSVLDVYFLAVRCSIRIPEELGSNCFIVLGSTAGSAGQEP